MKRHRQLRGTGALLIKNGKYEGRYKLYRRDGTSFEKSFTRATISEINDIKASLRVLGILDNDVTGVKIDKITNAVTLERKNSLLTKTSKKAKLDKNITVNDYIEYWLWNYRRKGMKGQLIKDTTFADYVQKSEYLKRKIGTIIENGKTVELKVSELNFDFLENAMLEIYSEYVYTTAVQVRNHLYNLMECAKKDNIIEINPFQEEKINFPRAPQKKERAYIKEEDIAKVIKYSLKLGYIDVFVQIITGARISEINGLRWTDINEKECEIKFTNSYSSIKQYKLDENNHIVNLGRKRRYSTLKSKNSERSIKISEEEMRVLVLHKILQQKLAQKLNKEFKETDPVFTTSTYTQLGRDDVNEKVKKVVKDLKIENWKSITSHCLRHSFCYSGLLNDVPLEYMQILLGHSSISVTREWYAHFDKKKVDDYSLKVNQNRTNAVKEYCNKLVV